MVVLSVLAALSLLDSRSRVQSVRQAFIALGVDYAAPEKVMAVERVVNTLARLGYPVFRADEAFAVDDGEGRSAVFGPGSFLINADAGKELGRLWTDLGAHGVRWMRSVDQLDVGATRIGAPQVAIFSGSGNSLAPLTAYGDCLERLGFMYDLIDPKQIRAGGLNRYTILIMTGGDEPWYGLALGSQGNKMIRDFIHLGGRYLSSCAGTYYASRRPVPGEEGAPGYDLKGYPGLRPVEFLRIFDFSCNNNLPRKCVPALVPKSTEFFKHGSRDVGFGACWYSDYLEVAQVNPFRISSRPWLINRQRNHPVMYGLPDRFWQLYAGGPMMIPGPGSRSLADYSPEIPAGQETFDRIVSGRLVLNASGILEGKFGQGRGVLFSCHPEKLAETYLIVANAMHYLTRSQSARLGLPLPTVEVEAFKTEELHQAKTSLVVSLQTIREACRVYQGRIRSLSQKMPACLKEPAEPVSRLAACQISAILAAAGEVESLLKGLSPNIRISLPVLASRRLRRVSAGLKSCLGLLDKIDKELESAEGLLPKMSRLSSPEQVRTFFAEHYFFCFMGKADLLSVGDYGINRWAPGFSTKNDFGALPALHAIQNELNRIREALECLHGFSRRR
jgi:hypothetical protein